VKQSCHVGPNIVMLGQMLSCEAKLLSGTKCCVRVGVVIWLIREVRIVSGLQPTAVTSRQPVEDGTILLKNVIEQKSAKIVTDSGQKTEASESVVRVLQLIILP
jgi:hypothetical protein